MAVARIDGGDRIRNRAYIRQCVNKLTARQRLSDDKDGDTEPRDGRIAHSFIVIGDDRATYNHWAGRTTGFYSLALPNLTRRDIDIADAHGLPVS